MTGGRRQTGSKQTEVKNGRENKVRHRQGGGRVVSEAHRGWFKIGARWWPHRRASDYVCCWLLAGCVGRSSKLPRALPRALFSHQAGEAPRHHPILIDIHARDDIPCNNFPSVHPSHASTCRLLFSSFDSFTDTALPTARRPLPHAGQPLPRLAFRAAILLEVRVRAGPRRARPPALLSNTKHCTITANSPSSPSPPPRHQTPTPTTHHRRRYQPTSSTAVSLATCSNPTPARLAFGPACCICKDSAASQLQPPEPSCVPVPAFSLQPATISPQPSILPIANIAGPHIHTAHHDLNTKTIIRHHALQHSPEIAVAHRDGHHRT